MPPEKKSWEINDKEAQKKAEEKYKTKKDVLRGIGWVNDKRKLIKPKYHKTPSSCSLHDRGAGFYNLIR